MPTPTLKQFINNAGIHQDADFKIQLASDASGSYVPVVAVDSGATAALPTNAAQETGGNLATLAGAVSSSKIQAVVGGKTVSITVTPTVTITNPYGVNYVVGGLLTFANAFTSTGSGILQSVVVTVKKIETSGFTFFPFNGNPSNTTWTDAAVAAINAADVSLVREPVNLLPNVQLGTHTVAYATGIGQAMAPGSTTLYGILIANNTLTNQFATTSDLTVTVKIIQDL